MISKLDEVLTFGSLTNYFTMAKYKPKFKNRSGIYGFHARRGSMMTNYKTSTHKGSVFPGNRNK
jgi:hypothetical protein